MAKPGRGPLRAAAWTLGLGAALILAAGVALRLAFPPEKIRQLVVEKASESLHREVRLRGVSLGLLKGFSLDGLEVSEKPDIKAGTFASVDQFVLKLELLPLISKRLVIDEITIRRPSIVVVKDAKGRFNFDDLAAGSTEKKPAKKDAAKSAESPIAFELKVRKASILGGTIDYRDIGQGMKIGVSGLDVVAKNLSFDQETGRLSADIERLAAAVSGLELRLAGAVALDPKKAELKDWHGRFDAGELRLALTARDYLKAPDVDVDLSLSSLDLDKLLAVKQATLGEAKSAPKSGSAAAHPEPSASSAPPMKTKGSAVIGRMLYSGAKVNETKLAWELSGITPDMRAVAGWAKLHIAGGSFTSEGGGGRNGLMKAMMLPVTVLQKLGSFLSPLKVFPDFSHLLFTEVVGDYAFSRGVMTVKDFHMDSAAAGVKTTGSIDLGAQRLALVAAVSPGNAAPILIDVGGTFDAPSAKPRLATLIRPDAVKKAADLLKNLHILK